MAEGSYEYECNRAELLGLPRPNREEFDASVKKHFEKLKEIEDLEAISIQDEQINNASGKFDEINSILSITQQRINTFKRACGSLTNLLKIRPNQETDIPENMQSSSSSNPTENGQGADINKADTANDTIDDALDTLEQMKTNEGASDISVIKKSSADMQQKMSCQFDKLDSMLSKAENAQYAMAQQNKDMKKILK